MPVKAPSMVEIHKLARTKGTYLTEGLVATYINDLEYRRQLASVTTFQLTRPQQRRIIKGILEAL